MKTALSVFATVVSIQLHTCAAEIIPALTLGSQAPDFHLPGVDGRSWSLAVGSPGTELEFAL